MLRTMGLYLLIDTSTDFRQQSLRYDIRRIDAVLFTHHHVDHIFGLDDIRVFNYFQQSRIQCYGRENSIREIKRFFSYIFEYPEIAGGVPQVDLNTVEGSFEVGDVQVVPIEIQHGRLPIFAYRIGDFAYATDCSGIPDDSLKQLDGLEVLVLDCLREKPHPTHFHLEQSIEIAQGIGAGQTYFTHISHALEHNHISSGLPENIHMAYDGLRLEM